MIPIKDKGCVTAAFFTLINPSTTQMWTVWFVNVKDI